MTAAKIEAILDGMKCKGPECRNEAVSRELCAGHLKQLTRHPERALKPLRQGAAFGAQVVFSVTPKMKRGAELAAEREGVDPSEWWRRAGAERLKR